MGMLMGPTERGQATAMGPMLVEGERRMQETLTAECCGLRATTGNGGCRRATSLGPPMVDEQNGRRETWGKERNLPACPTLLLAPVLCRALFQAGGPLHKAQSTISLVGECWGREWEATQTTGHLCVHGSLRALT